MHLNKLDQLNLVTNRLENGNNMLRPSQSALELHPQLVERRMACYPNRIIRPHYRTKETHQLRSYAKY